MENHTLPFDDEEPYFYPLSPEEEQALRQKPTFEVYLEVEGDQQVNPPQGEFINPDTFSALYDPPTP